MLLSLSLILLIKSIKFENKKYQYINDNIQLFLYFLNLASKLVISYLYIKNENDFDSTDISRILMYQCLSTNVYMIIKLEANILISLFYLALNFIFNIISIILSKKNSSFFLEFVLIFFIYFVFYLIQKEWDFRLRSLFAEKYKFEAVYLYSLNSLYGLNAFTIKIKNNLEIFCDQIVCNFAEKILNENNPDNILNDDNNSKNQYNLNIQPRNLERKNTEKLHDYPKYEQNMIAFLKNLRLTENFDDIKPNLISKELSKENILLFNNGKSKFYSYFK